MLLFASGCEKTHAPNSSSRAPSDRKVHVAASDGNDFIQANPSDLAAELPKVPRSAEELVALLADEKDYHKGVHLLSTWLTAAGSFDEKVEMCIQLPVGQMRSACYNLLCFDAIQNENPEQLFRLYESAPIGKDRARVAASLGVYITDKYHAPSLSPVAAGYHASVASIRSGNNPPIPFTLIFGSHRHE